MGSFFLFAMPSFLGGVARLLDLGGTFNSYNEGVSPEEADTVATYVDWLTVGNDIQFAISRIRPEIIELAVEDVAKEIEAEETWPIEAAQEAQLYRAD